MADKVGFSRVAEWIRSDDEIKIIVLSAGGKTARLKKVTDVLIDAGNRILSGEPVNKSLAQFTDRVISDAKAIGLDSFIKDELMKIEQEVEKDFSLDFILSRGEYFYAKLFSLYYGLPFIDSASLIGFYDDGSLNLGLCEYRIKKCYERVGRFVTGGFYGAYSNGKIKTFTRGGSDFSGAIMARGINATEYLNFTDVDGIYPLDPKIKKSMPIDEISFDTVRLLGEYGAGVLHPASVLPLYGTNTGIRLRNTFNNRAIGTLIKEFTTKKPFAVAFKTGCYYIKAVNRGKGYFLLDLFKKSGIKIICVSSSLDFFECCFEGDIKVDTRLLGGADFIQVEEALVMYFSPCDKSKDVIKAITESFNVFFSVEFCYGAYVVIPKAQLIDVEKFLCKN